MTLLRRSTYIRLYEAKTKISRFKMVTMNLIKISFFNTEQTDKRSIETIEDMTLYEPLFDVISLNYTMYTNMYFITV